MASHKFKFVFQKTDGQTILIKYRLNDDKNWKTVDEAFQSIENHVALTNISEVDEALNEMVRQRTLTVSLSDTIAEPYLNDEYIATDHSESGSSADQNQMSTS